MKAPLYNGLMNYSHTKKTFHMPGHKLGSFGDLNTLELMRLDVTEANGLDNLYEAEGIIKEAMEELSRFYGSKETIMLTNGSTAGILASILTLCKPGEKLLVARNCHHSVWHGLILSGAIPIYIEPEYDTETGLLIEMKKETIEKALEQHPDAKGVLIVSPTYEGVVSDIEGIEEVVHQKDKCLIVDEAHGAHFVLDDYFPKSSLELGADIVIQSMHKTLPTLTQSALLHIGTRRINKEALVKSLRMIQTSSPSYAMMGLMDYIRAYIEQYKEDIKEEYIKPLEESRKALKELEHLSLIEYLSFYDKSKIIISTDHTLIDGYKLADLLEENYDIVCEAALPHYIILMTTLADNEKTLGFLVEALQKIDKSLTKAVKQTDKENKVDLKKLYGTETFSPRDIYYAEEENKPLEYCEGFISKENIMLYPPGIPILCIGEVITKEHIDLINQWKDKLKGIIRDKDKIICKVARVDLQ